MFKLTKIVAAVSVLGFVVMTGCSGPSISGLEKEIQALNKTNIAKVRSLYELYKGKNGMRAPKDKEELIGFLKSKASLEKYLNRIGVEADQLDSYFVSERDGEEFKIKWGVNGVVEGPYVFESTGVDGVRLACGSELVELNQSEYETQWKAKPKAVKMDGGGGNPKS